MNINYQRLITGEQEEEKLWELYHENSRITPYQAPVSYSELQAKMLDLIISYQYQGYSSLVLEKPMEQFDLSLTDTIKKRKTALNIQPVDISPQQLSSILYYGYGVSRSNEDSEFPHPFRMIPSAGALYPLEIFFHHNYVQAIDAGLYHYNPMLNTITRLSKGDRTRELRDVFVQPEISINSSVLFFITAVMERSSFKYGERAYRFVHLEAGHLAQNMCLVAHAMGLGAITIGGFIDRKANEFIGCDGLNHAVIYVVAIGLDQNV